VLAGWIFAAIAGGVAMTLPFSILSDSVTTVMEDRDSLRSLLTAIGASLCFKAVAASAVRCRRGPWPPTATFESAPDGVGAGGNEIGFHLAARAFFALALLPTLFYSRYEAMEPRIRQELISAAP